MSVNSLRIKLLVSISIGFLIVTASLFFVFDRYVRNASAGVIQGWLEIQAIELQQSNYLSALTKGQRVITSSDLITGMSLQKISNGKITRLINIGDIENSSIALSCPRDGIEPHSNGLFKYIFSYCFNKEQNVEVHFYSKPTKLLWIFYSSLVIATLFFCAFVVSVIYFSRAEYVTQMKLQNYYIQLAQRVAHDIRSPLSVINIISSRIKTESPEDGNLLNAAGTQLTKIANELLLRIKENKNPIKYNEEAGSKIQDQEITIVGLLDSSIVVEQLKLFLEMKLLEISESKIRLNCYDLVGASSVGKVNFDKVNFLRAFSNLLNNAIEAVDKNDNPLVSVTFEVIDKILRIEIRDNGIGIEESLLLKLGEQNISQGKSNGNGIGFMSAKKIIQRMNGQLKVISKVGIGTTIVISLPIIMS